MNNNLSQSAEWLNSLVDDVFNCIEAHNPMGPLEYRYRNEEDYWKIVIYPTPVELKGGIVEGTVVSPGFSLDVQQLIDVFDQVDEMNWRSQGFGPWDYDGPHISMGGIYQKHNIWLQVLAEAPADTKPGMKLDTTGKRLKAVLND
jgi:hypothetical protein